MAKTPIIEQLQKVNPVRFAIFVALFSVLITFLSQFFMQADDAAWLVSMAGLLLYAWLVAVVSFFNKQWASYTWQSILCYFLLAILLGLVAYLVSGISIFKLREYQLLISAVTLFFFVAIVMSKVIRGIRNFLESEER